MTCHTIALLIPTLVAAAAPAAAAQSGLVPNNQFHDGTQSPAHWVLSGGKGQWLDKGILSVTGNGQDSNYWLCREVRFEPGALYRFRMRARRLSGTGTVVCGPSFANRDFRAVAKNWQEHGFVFRAPENAVGGYLRLGQWHLNGTAQFDSVGLVKTLPVHSSSGGQTLGRGESIRKGRYTFHGSFDHEGANFHRPLTNATAGFNSNRWTFGAGSQITYRFELPGIRQRSATLGFDVNYHTGGSCVAEVSGDGQLWRELARQSKPGQCETLLPGELFPNERVFIRLRGQGTKCSFQVDRIEYGASLDGAVADQTGQTLFADVRRQSSELKVARLWLQEASPEAEPILSLSVKNGKQQPIAVTLKADIAWEGRGPQSLSQQQQAIAAGQEATFRLPIAAGEPGEHRLHLQLGSAATNWFETELTLSVPEYYRSDYGHQLAGVSSSQVGVWCCQAAWKVPPQRVLPTASCAAVQLSAARNDFEAVQVIVRPLQTLTGLTATAGDLRGPKGSVLPAESVRVLRVAYHDVQHPTDRTGVRGRWPDALPPLTRPIDVPAGENQPLWVLIHVTEDALAGDYQTELTLAAKGWSVQVPVHLHVWNFALPKRNHLQTAFGFSPGSVFRYHQLKTEADKRRVLDMYFQCFAEHRISPYDPVPLDHIQVRFRPEAKPPRTDLDFRAFDVAMQRAVDRFHFTGYRLPIQGMGGGTFHARHEPKIGDFGEKTSQYQAMFSSYVKQLQEHLRNKGWLEMAYVYWFDEPAPRDYEFVSNGMQRLNRYAPDLQRMLTEEPVDELAGAVDIWCPVTPNYDHERAQARRVHGEQFWWYVCTGPKAPFCTLFIDHPATELRVWVWQTWQRNIKGLLVWQSNYWTSSAAFPDKPQNPYEDPMGYVSGYSTPRGVRRHWGNGDGSFHLPAGVGR